MTESCGKCIPCRAGTRQMHGLLTKIGEGRATRRRPGAARGALRHGPEHQPLRPRPGGARTPCSARCATSATSIEASPSARDGSCRPEPAACSRPRRHVAPRPTGRPLHDQSATGPRQDPDHRRQATSAPARTRRSSKSPARTASRSRPSATSTGLSDVGACRLCLVEVKGVTALLPACVTRVAEGMEVTADSERLQRYRRDDPRAALRRAQPHLLGLRGQRPLRAAVAGPASSA